jgi:hypothetical protein
MPGPLLCSSGNAQVYSVPIIYQDLRPQETFFQVCDALQNLNNIVDGVFGAIQTRVRKYHLINFFFNKLSKN